MDLRLKLLDALAALRAGQFKPARRGRGRSINQKEIEHRIQQGKNKDEYGPQPLTAAEGIDQHPNLKYGQCQPEGTADQIIPLSDTRQQGGEHASKLSQRRK
jgi:hypothetical protein